MEEKMFATGVDLSKKVRSSSIDILNARLADTLDMMAQVKQAHWNVKGMHFYQLHILFDEIAERLENFADTIAERITALGGVALGTSRLVAKRSSLPEYNLKAVKGEQHVKALSSALAKLANATRASIDKAIALNDQATADVLIEVARGADKDLWFLEAHLQG